MATPQTNNTMAGWDIGLAAFSLACMTSGFWRLWPGAVALDDAPLGALILKSGIAALGFVGIATRWEDVVKAWARNPLVLVLLALACSSTIWAIVPADALRNSIILIVVWIFGIALCLRFKPRELSEICAFAGLFGLMAQFGAHQGMPPVSAFDGDVAFGVIGCAWAAWCVPSRRSMWILALGVCCTLGFAAGDTVVFGAGAGLIIGFGLAQVSALQARQGGVSVIVSAWVIVALIIGVTLFALFGAAPVTTKIAAFFEALGAQAVLGQGFGTQGHSVASSLGAGLGLVGVALGGLVVFATLFQALLGGRDVGKGVDGNVAVWFACLGAMVVSPADISIFGPVCILLAATSFSISLSCLSAPRPRQSLVRTAENQRFSQNRNRPTRRGGAPIQANLSLSSMGLRPRR
jgi:hypothetical protein